MRFHPEAKLRLYYRNNPANLSLMLNPAPSLHPLWSSLSLERFSGVSLQDQITGFFRAAIVSGRIPRGRRVPSSRQLAQEHGISRTTAIEAYERLVAEGYLVSRPGAGVFIADVLPEDVQHTALGTSAGNKSAPAEERQIANQDGRNYQLPLAPDMPAIDKFPWAAWARLMNQICRERPLNAIGYGDPQGELALREAVVEYLAVARGIVCRPRQVLVMSGTEQMLAFAARQVATAGSAVCIEDPGYAFLHHTMAGLGRRPLAIPLDAEGIDLASFSDVPDVRLVIVSPSHEYPLSITMSLARREALLGWAHERGAWILENEIDGDYRYTSRPLTPLYALAHGQRVIYCGSLSKPLAPGLRINYMVVPEELIGSLAIGPTLAPMLTQLVLARFSTSGQMAAHMRKMRLLYAKRRTRVLDALRVEAAGLLDVDNLPEGGLRIVAALPMDVPDTVVAERCLKAGLKVDALSRCYVRAPRRSGLIMGFASTPEEQTRSAVGMLASVLRQVMDETV
jgi:GntR family transcriptional regulator/MocR family aminotransferase